MEIKFIDELRVGDQYNDVAIKKLYEAVKAISPELYGSYFFIWSSEKGLCVHRESEYSMYRKRTPTIVFPTPDGVLDVPKFINALLLIT